MEDLGTHLRSVKFFKFEEYSRACFEFFAGFLRFETFTVFECFEYVEILLSSGLLETLSLCCRQKKIKFLREIKKTLIRYQKATTIFHLPHFSLRCSENDHQSGRIGLPIIFRHNLDAN